jgi:putative Mn2+ efflux pump MntP
MIPETQAVGIGMAGIIAGAAVLIGVGSRVVKEAFKTRQKSIEQKRAASRDEVEKKKYEFLNSAIRDSVEGMRSVSLGILQAGTSAVSVDNKAVSTNEIRSAADEAAEDN